MSEHLYFISIIARALQEPDIKKALKKAFRKIKRMGSEKRYAEGFENFELFMDAAYSRHQIIATDHISELMAQLATGMFEGSAQEVQRLLDTINSHPEWKAQFEAIRRSEADENIMQESPVIAVSGDKGLAIERTFRKVPGCESFDRIVPGIYTVRLVNTGWVIWEGKLTTEELIWSEAHENKNLPMAAETEGIKKEATYQEDLLGGDLILRTYAGLESGSIELELTR